MAVKIIARSRDTARSRTTRRRPVVVTVEFDGPSEGLTFTVLVPSDPDESMVREQAIARAQDLARQFAEVRRGH